MGALSASRAISDCGRGRGRQASQRQIISVQPEIDESVWREVEILARPYFVDNLAYVKYQIATSSAADSGGHYDAPLPINRVGVVSR